MNTTTLQFAIRSWLSIKVLVQILAKEADRAFVVGLEPGAVVMFNQSYIWDRVSARATR